MSVTLTTQRTYDTSRNWWRDLDGWLPTLAWAFNGWGITSFYQIRNVSWSLTYLPANDSGLEMEQIILSDAREGSRQLRLCILWSKAGLERTIERLLSVFNKWGSRFLILASAIGQIAMSTTSWERQKRGNLQKSSVQHTTRNHATNKARWVIDPD
jgi:hypothetical protein